MEIESITSELDVFEISRDELAILMDTNAAQAETIYKLIKNSAKSMFNDQDVINWQDRLNAVSLIPEGDL